MLLDGTAGQELHVRRHHALARWAGAAESRGARPGVRQSVVAIQARARDSRRGAQRRHAARDAVARWEDTVGWVANLLEMFPENPFTTGAEFVANGIVWIARHASGDLPGIRSMDGDGELIRELQIAAGSAAGSVFGAGRQLQSERLAAQAHARRRRRSVLQHRQRPGRSLGRRLARRPGRRIVHSRQSASAASAPAATSIATTSRTSTSSRSRRRPTFLVETLGNQPHKLQPLDPALRLPDRQLTRAGGSGVSAPQVSVAGRPAAARRSRFTGRPGPARSGGADDEAEHQRAQRRLVVRRVAAARRPLPCHPSHRH